MLFYSTFSQLTIINGKLIIRKLLIILFVIQLSGLVYAQQTETNLQLYLKLAKSISEKLAAGENLTALPDSSNYYKYSVLYNVWKKSKKNRAVKSNKIRIDTVITEYPDLYRSGLFGDYYLVRKLKMIYSPESKPELKDSVSFLDTLFFTNRSRIENSAFPFTKGKLPEEPFLSSIFEPIIYVGVTITLIYLLFVTRS